MKFKSRCLVACLLWLVGARLGVASAEVDYSIWIGAINTDNASRTLDDGIDETITVAGFTLDVANQTRRVNFQLESDLEYQHYGKDTYDSDYVGSISGDVVFQFVPDLLSWVIEERFGKSQSNPFQPDTPDNRENANNFSTGPDLHIRLGSRSSLELGARYQTNNFEIRDIDNEVVGSSISFVRALSPHRTISINAEFDQVDYEETLLGGDFDRASAFIGFSSEIPRGTITLNLGVNEVDVDGMTSDGLLANASWTRELTTRSTLSVSFDQRYSDAADIFRRFFQGDLTNTGSEGFPGSSEPFENRRISATFNHRRNSSTLAVAITSNEEDYETTNDLDRDRLGITFGLSREFGGGWELGGNVRYLGTDFGTVDRKDDDINAGIQLSKRLGQNLYADFAFEYLDRESDVISAIYTENRFSLKFRYAPQ